MKLLPDRFKSMFAPKQKFSHEATLLCQKWEGWRARVYLDPIGIPTVGYGHVVLPGEHITTLTASEGLALLDADLTKAQAIVLRAVTVPLTQGQLDALCSFVFNVGHGKRGIKDGFVELENGRPSTMLRKLNAGDYAGAALEFPRWVHAGGKKLNGLVSRRDAELSLFLT